jgi:hypothetical protein
MRKLLVVVAGVLCVMFLAPTTEHAQYTAKGNHSCATENPLGPPGGGFGLCPAGPSSPVGRGVKPRMQQPSCSDPCSP